ncbi:Zinc finger BED domain-containing protein 4, partial [Aphis craccivora]
GKHGTNLIRHLSNHIELYHEMQLKNIEKKKSTATKKMSILEAHEKLFQLTPDIKVKIDMNTIINACVELVTVNGRPYSMLNDTGFRKIIDPVLKGINKKVCINSNSIKKYVYEESISIKNEINIEVQSKAKLVSLKLDAVTWLNRSFLGINIQYIIDDYIELKTLALIELTESHTGVYLKDTILNVLRMYQIEPDQVYTITSDNGANMLKAVNLIEKEILELQQQDSENIVNIVELDSSDNDSINSSEIDYTNSVVNLDEKQIIDLLEENPDSNVTDKDYEKTENILTDIQSFQSFGDSSIFTGIRCVAHTLQLAVIDSLKDSGIEKLLNKVRVLVRKLRNQTYIYLLKKENLKSPILDCLTRWHSTFDILERINHLKEFIQNMAKNDSLLKKVCLNNMEWKQIDIISQALLPAKICTKKLQNEQLTMSDFYGAWILCKIETESINSSFSKVILECLKNREKYIMKNKVLLS